MPNGSRRFYFSSVSTFTGVKPSHRESHSFQGQTTKPRFLPLSNTYTYTHSSPWGQQDRLVWGRHVPFTSCQWQHGWVAVSLQWISLSLSLPMYLFLILFSYNENLMIFLGKQTEYKIDKMCAYVLRQALSSAYLFYLSARVTLISWTDVVVLLNNRYIIAIFLIKSGQPLIFKVSVSLFILPYFIFTPFCSHHPSHLRRLQTTSVWALITQGTAILSVLYSLLSLKRQGSLSIASLLPFLCLLAISWIKNKPLRHCKTAGPDMSNVSFVQRLHWRNILGLGSDYNSVKFLYNSGVRLHHKMYWYSSL